MKLGTSRVCGPCSLCCTSMSVPSQGKPADTRCVHLRQGACGIYKDRPDECRTFECLWRAGALPNELRPDKVKAVAYTNPENTVLILRVLPVHRGAHRKGKLQEYIQRVAARGMSVVVCCGDERSLYGPLADEGATIETYSELDEQPTLVHIQGKKR